MLGQCGIRSEILILLMAQCDDFAYYGHRFDASGLKYFFIFSLSVLYFVYRKFTILVWLTHFYYRYMLLSFIHILRYMKTKQHK